MTPIEILSFLLIIVAGSVARYYFQRFNRHNP